MQTRQAGFTLIELMIVIAIIAALVATATIGIGIAQKNQYKLKTQTTITQLATWIEQLKSPDNMGAYPPTVTTDLVGGGMKPEKVGQKVGMPNETNVGIETIYLTTQIKDLVGAPDFGGDKVLENFDEDEGLELVGNMQKRDLFEFVDAYGNPLCYFNARDYKDPKKVAQYVLGNGQTVKAEPKTSDKTGQFFRANSFQLFSFGPDGIPNTEDDIHYGEF